MFYKLLMKRFGGANVKILKSAVALAIILVIGYFASPYVEHWMSERFGSSSKASKAQAAPAGGPPIPQAMPVVGHVIERADLALSREYIGRVEPIQTVFVRPRVSGQIESVNFKEGAIVKEGDVLFTLDGAQHQATVQLRNADLAKAEANLSRAVKYNDRLMAADKRSVSASDVDMAASDVQQSQAAVEQAKAALRLARIDLGFTKITAPISGRIGRAEATRGNYVTPAGGHLASIVQINPIRVSYALPDRSYMDQIEVFQTSDDVYNTTLVLANGTEYPIQGERDFESNAIDFATGTLTVFLRFENEQGTLVPGGMVRVVTKPARARVAPVLPQEAVISDSRGDFVYTIGEGNVVQRRDVKLGAEVGVLREIISGLVPGEKVVARGIQNLRPGMQVKPFFPETDASSRSPAERARESGFDLPAVDGLNTTKGNS
jgi:RND family efflux transporter MFP subunit